MNLLPEYNEILYHAKVCSELEFREYWNEVQSRLSVEVTDEEIDKQADYKYDNTSIQRSAWIGGAKWMRDRLTRPNKDMASHAQNEKGVSE